MFGRCLHRSHCGRIAVRSAFFAIALIIVAPLISVFLQNNMIDEMPGMQHAHISRVADPHSAHNATPDLDEHSTACGYCVLLVTTPGVLTAFALLVFAQASCLRSRVCRPVAHNKFSPPWLYPHTRAPPHKMALTY